MEREFLTSRLLKTATGKSDVEPAQMAVPPELKKQWNACPSDKRRHG